MPVALHAAAEHGAVEHVEGGEQGGGAVALVVVGHGAGAALLHGQAGLGAVERLDLATSRRPTAPRHGPAGRHRGRRCRWSLGTNSGSFESLKRRTRCGARPCAFQMRCTEDDADAGRLGHGGSGPVGRLVRRLGAVRATTRSMTSWPSGATREGRVLSRSSPSTPSSAKRSCQRQTQVFDLPGPPHDLDGAEAARRKQHDLGPPGMLLGALRFAATAFRWRRMAGVTVRDIPVRIQQIHMPRPNRNPPTGFKC